MRGTAYAIMNWEELAEISLSRLNAQEILMDYALEAAYDIFCLYYNYHGCTFEGAMKEANREVDHWQIWTYNLV